MTNPKLASDVSKQNLTAELISSRLGEEARITDGVNTGYTERALVEKIAGILLPKITELVEATPDRRAALAYDLQTEVKDASEVIKTIMQKGGFALLPDYQQVVEIFDENLRDLSNSLQQVSGSMKAEDSDLRYLYANASCTLNDLKWIIVGYPAYEALARDNK